MRLRKRVTFIMFFVLSVNVFAQKLYNNKVKAEIKVDYTSEFLTVTAMSENIDYSDFNLRYEFLVFKTDVNGNTSKSTQSNRFFLKGNEKKILSSITLNNNEEGKAVLVLLIYPLNKDVEQGAIGKDRVVIYSESGAYRVEYDDESKNNTVVDANVDSSSKDQDDASKDGVFIEGLVIQKTLTKAGRDFYRYFYSEYYNKQIKTGKNILITEVPGQRRSTRISVKVDGQLVWQFFSNPKKEFLKEMASISVQRSLQYLQRMEQQNQNSIQY